MTTLYSTDKKCEQWRYWLMNINRYISINSSLFVIGLYSNITIVISLFSIYHAINLIKNSYKCGIWIKRNIVLIVAIFLMLDFFDVVRFIFEKAWFKNLSSLYSENIKHMTWEYVAMHNMPPLRWLFYVHMKALYSTL